LPIQFGHDRRVFGLPLGPLIGRRVVAEMLANVIASLLPDRRPFGVRAPRCGKLAHQRTDGGPLLGCQLSQPRVGALVNFDHLGCHTATVHHWYTEFVAREHERAGAVWAWYDIWYSHTVSVQMTVRIPDNLAKYVDDSVRSGGAASRAEMIARALEELMRREEREREMALVDNLNARNESLYPDLDGLAEWGVRRPMDID
jgi:Arc/MetJ-type ribon-helix-helix transcriptional regulator